jgi:tryptophan-rich sensory protein
MHRGLDYVKHRMEDAYDTTPQTSGNWFTNLFSRQQPSYAQQMGTYGARKIGQKVAETFTGRDYGHQQRGLFGGRQYGQSGGMFGYGHEEEPSFFSAPLEYLEHNVFNSTIGPLMFVAWPLILGLFISSWAHKQIRTNRAWYDKISLPLNVPPSWLYDPMWTVVLTAMGYASWLVFEEGGFGNWLSLGLYNFGLMMLVSWPLVFFSLHDTIAAPILGTILTGILGLTSVIFGFYSITASLLMSFATAWVGYMTIVNWQVYSKNTGLSRVSGTKEKGEWPWSSTATSGVSAGVTPVEARFEAKKVR